MPHPDEKSTKLEEKLNHSEIALEALIEKIANSTFDSRLNTLTKKTTPLWRQPTLLSIFSILGVTFAWLGIDYWKNSHTFQDALHRYALNTPRIIKELIDNDDSEISKSLEKNTLETLSDSASDNVIKTKFIHIFSEQQDAKNAFKTAIEDQIRDDNSNFPQIVLSTFRKKPYLAFPTINYVGSLDFNLQSNTDNIDNPKCEDKFKDTSEYRKLCLVYTPMAPQKAFEVSFFSSEQDNVSILIGMQEHNYNIASNQLEWKKVDLNNLHLSLNEESVEVEKTKLSIGDWRIFAVKNPAEALSKANKIEGLPRMLNFLKVECSDDLISQGYISLAVLVLLNEGKDK
ncbi:MAG: hypothetical protein U1E45_24690 [Geminicoccaceae bacterium]